MAKKKKKTIIDLQVNAKAIMPYNCEVRLSLLDFSQNDRSFPCVHFLEHVHFEQSTYANQSEKVPLYISLCAFIFLWTFFCRYASRKGFYPSLNDSSRAKPQRCEQKRSKKSSSINSKL